MENFLPIIARSALFNGVSPDEITAMLNCLAATKASYDKGQFILGYGEEINAVGMVLSGSIYIINEDFWGNRNILAQAGPGDLFAEVYACLPGATLNISVVAEEAATVLFLDVRRILTTCTSACSFHARLIRNLLSTLAEKNLRFSQKLEHMAQRTTREKLLSYLSAEGRRQGGPSFSIPFNRQQLADYLSVDRSAMSNELSKMRDQGLLNFNKNSFTLLTKD